MAAIPKDRGRCSRNARRAKSISIPTDKALGAKRRTRRRDRPHPKRAKRAILPSARNPQKTGHRRARHRFTFRHTPQDARSPRRTKCAARASCMSEDVPKSKPMAGPDDYRAIYYPVFCRPAETPVTVERIRLIYSAFFSSAISSWFIRTSRRARTWAIDRAST